MSWCLQICQHASRGPSCFFLIGSVCRALVTFPFSFSIFSTASGVCQSRSIIFLPPGHWQCFPSTRGVFIFSSFSIAGVAALSFKNASVKRPKIGAFWLKFLSSSRIAIISRVKIEVGKTRKKHSKTSWRLQICQDASRGPSFFSSVAERLRHFCRSKT